MGWTRTAQLFLVFCYYYFCQIRYIYSKSCVLFLSKGLIMVDFLFILISFHIQIIVLESNKTLFIKIEST